jgi:hypothetical protein
MEYWSEFTHLLFLFVAFFLLIAGSLVIFKAGVALLPLPNGLKEATAAV